MLLIGVDVGGTFTDLVLTDTDANTSLIHKVPSTPTDPSKAVLQGVEEICNSSGMSLSQIDHIFHGTTVATNAVLQHRGAVAGMITTRGFRDIVHIGRHQRPHHYSIQQDIPWQVRPLVKRRHRKVVTERLSSTGEVVEPLNEDEVRQAADELRDAGIESIAICFLFAFINPQHEQRTKAIVQDVCPGVFVTCSHEVSPQFREFERFTTAAMNAFIGPLVRDYVNSLADNLKSAGFRGEVHIMRSNGGVATAKTISELPVYTLMSGLVAGVLGSARIGQQTGRGNLITLDIGGTSADIGVVTGGRFSESSARDTTIGGYPVLVPMIDMHTIGAGGGSIAYVDEAGAFRVGPQSAGADPGPAAYGQGGTEPTVTDANIVLGRLDTGNFLGGAMSLDRSAATATVQGLAGVLGLDLVEAAEGVIAILNANMANAIRVRTVQKGRDPREYALVVSGGAGPLHGVEVARMLGIPEVIVPPHPGINSAEGLLTTDLKYELVKTAFLSSSDMDFDRLNADLTSMKEQLRGQLTADGINPDEADYEQSADVRYVGQGYELCLPLPKFEIDEKALQGAIAEFHKLHQKEYGHHFPDAPLEFVNLRISGIGRVPKIGDIEIEGGSSIKEAMIRRDDTVFRIDDELKTFETAFLDRARLPIDTEFEGPAIILQTDSTTVVPPGCTARQEKNGSLIIKTGEKTPG